MYIKTKDEILGIIGGLFMNHQEYASRLDYIEEQLERGLPIKQVLKMLDELYAYKPVSVRYHQIKCKALMKRKVTEELLLEFEDKISKECIFEGNIELWQQIIEIYFTLNRAEEGERQQYLLNKLIKNADYLDEENKLNKIRKIFLEGNESQEILRKLEDQYFITCNRLMAYCVYFYRSFLYPETQEIEKKKLYENIDNMLYLSERLTEKIPMILIAENEQKEDYDLLAYILYAMHVPVYMIVDTVEIEGDYKWEDSVKISIDNQQIYKEGTAIWAISKTKDAKAAESNIPYLIDYICKEQTEEDFCMVISSNKILEELRIHKQISKRFERLSLYEARQIENEIGFGWSGDYYTYISKLYNYDVREWIDRETEYEFSIVIPVRNVTTTLEHTLRTCLEQNFSGNYEIVLSDNSVGENKGIYNLYKRLNNTKIHYYKTPRDLGLTKSFEYAYLQTKGNYIISIGADDAVLPWTLQILSILWKENKERNIVLWDRGFYAWSGFNDGQQNELVIPFRYRRGELNVQLWDSEECFAVAEKNPIMMYTLPNLYINSGFQRRYIKELYEKTGRLWDGRSQDIYMGVQNIAINKDILYLNYPLTLAGMSNNSIGALCVKIIREANNRERDQYHNILSGKGIYSYVLTDAERIIPFITSDVSAFFGCIIRVLAKGILKSDFCFGIKELKLVYGSLDRASDQLDKFIHEGYAIALLQGEAFQSEYENEILPILNEHIYVDIEQKKKQKKNKMYQEGFTEKGGVILDASRYGVTNIYEAVQLFKNFLHF